MLFEENLCSQQNKWFQKCILKMRPGHANCSTLNRNTIVVGSMNWNNELLMKIIYVCVELLKMFDVPAKVVKYNKNSNIFIKETRVWYSGISTVKKISFKVEVDFICNVIFWQYLMFKSKILVYNFVIFFERQPLCINIFRFPWNVNTNVIKCF